MFGGQPGPGACPKGLVPPAAQAARPVERLPPRLGRIGQEAQTGEPGLATAGRAATEVVAGDPQPVTVEQHVVGTVPARPAVQTRGAGRVEDQRPTGRPGGEPGQARVRYRAATGLVAGVLVVEPP